MLLSLATIVALSQPIKVQATSYNPHPSQTDSRPCVGASGVDQCKLAKKGIRILALSQDLVGRAAWKPFRYHEWVHLESDNPQCHGDFLVLDTMHARFRRYADLFFLDRSQNTSCTATILPIKR